MRIISKTQLKKELDKKSDILLINVLPKADFDKRHIPASINIPFEDSENFIRQVEKKAKSKNQHIVVYCKNTECQLSKQAAEKLNESGFTDVDAFEEGVEGWFETGGSQAAA